MGIVLFTQLQDYPDVYVLTFNVLLVAHKNRIPEAIPSPKNIYVSADRILAIFTHRQVTNDFVWFIFFFSFYLFLFFTFIMRKTAYHNSRGGKLLMKSLQLDDDLRLLHMVEYLL